MSSDLILLVGLVGLIGPRGGLGGLLGVSGGWAALYALGAAVVLGIALPREKGSILRSLLISVAVLAVLLLALRPGWNATVEPVAITLVTPGADPERLDDAPAKRFRLEAAEAPRDIPAIPDAGWLQRHYPSAPSLAILGHGLAPWDWAPDGPRVNWVHRPPLSAGVSRVAWPRSILLGEPFRVQGRLSHAASTERTIRIEGPGGLESSVVIPPEAESTFDLEAMPRDTGRFLYRLSVEGAQDPITEVLDVQVEAPRSLAVLWLESSPSFETRAFRSWLKGQGGSVVIRTTISRERFRREFHDHPEVDLDRIDVQLVRRFDLVVLDDGTWQDLAPGERRAVLLTAREEGTGVLLRSNGKQGAAGSELPPWGEFEQTPVGDLERMTVEVVWPGSPSPSNLSVPAREIRLPAGSFALAGDSSGRILAAARPAVAGNLGICLLEGTFRWTLEGNPATHHRFWAHMVQALARGPAGARWGLPPGPVLVDQPLPLTLQGDPGDAVVTDASGERIPLALRQDPLEPGRWGTTFWPTRSGWYRLESGAGDPAWFHAQERERWSAWQELRKQSATAQQVMLAKGRPEAAGPARERRGIPVAPLLALLLGSLFFLWFQERW